MKTSILKLVKWFCLRLTLNELHSAIDIMLEVISGSRTDIQLKPEENPPNYRSYKVDTVPPLLKPLELKPVIKDWTALKKEHKQRTGKDLSPVRRRNGKVPPEGCKCNHCSAPRRYLYLNNGKILSQVQCKICGQTSSTDKCRTESKAKYWCPHCGKSLYKWKENSINTIFKCSNKKCPHALKNRKKLTPEEVKMCDDGKTSQFKIHYQFREYHFSPSDLKCARPPLKSKVDLGKIHNNYHVLSLVLTLSVNLGLSSRVTRDALKGLFSIDISHQTVINYIHAAAGYLQPFIDSNCPVPEGISAADETYIIVRGKWHYTWFIIDSVTRAICGYNLSNNRGAQPALALLYDCFGNPKDKPGESFELSTDGNPSYDNAVMAYNFRSGNEHNKIIKRTVIGLRNLDKESREYRSFKQLVERLNRTYKYHTRPRSGFKSFDGAVALTVLFIGFYNFMRPHSSIKKCPVELECLKGIDLYPQMWSALLQQAS